MSLPHSPMDCPMDAILRLIMGQWTSYILWMLFNKGPSRFGVLKREIEGVSSKVLTERLRMLEKHKIISREVKPASPPEVTYSLTQRGSDLITILSPLFGLACEWIEEDKDKEEEQEVSTF